MGVTTRPVSTVIDGVTYTTHRFDAFRAFNLYAEVGAAIPEEVMAFLMLPVSRAFEVARSEGQSATDAVADSSLAVVADMLVALEDPEILGKLSKTFLRDAASIPGGIAALMQRVLAQTTASPIRIAEGMQGESDGPIAQHFATHFGSDLMGMKSALHVCAWVLRVNLGKPSSDAP